MFGKNTSLNKKFIDNFFFYVLCILPWFLVTGPFLPDLLQTAVSLYFLIIVVSYKKWDLLKDNFLYLFIIFYFYIIFNSIFNSGEFISIKSALPFIRFGIFILALNYLIINNLHQISKLFYSFLILFLILVIDSIFQKVFGYNIIGIKAYSDIRISSFFMDELKLGSFIIKITPLLFMLIFYTNLKNKFFYLSIILLFSFIPIFLSAEKSAFVLFLLFSLSFFLVYPKKILNKIIVFFLLLMLIFSFFYANPLVKKRLITNTLYNSVYGSYIFSQVHHSHYLTAYKMFLDKPVIGQGPKVFRIKCNEKKYSYNELSCSTHPHNFYIQLLAETGIVGFSFLFFFYIFLLFNFYKSLHNFFLKKINYREYFSLVNLLLIFFPFGTSGNFFNNWNAAIYSFAIGFYFFSKKNLQLIK